MCSGRQTIECKACTGTGYCHTCYPYRLQWKRASDLAKSGDAYNAVALLLEMVKQFEQAKLAIAQENQKRAQTAREKNLDDQFKGRMIGGGVGAVIGMFLGPVGTIAGGMVGGMLGKAAGESEGKEAHQEEYRLSSFEAETHYRLGVIYEVLQHPATLTHYMQAKLLHSDHAGAEGALRRLQPSVANILQLKALDDDI